MTDEDLQSIILMLIKIAGIVVALFNVGIGLILLRQAFTMNNVLKINSGIMFSSMILIFLLLTGGVLFYSLLI